MEKIYSKIKIDTLLHIVLRKEDAQEPRLDIIDADQFLQLATMKLQKGKIFQPHRHIYDEKTTKITQESWVVIQGMAKAILYDLDDKVLSEEVLKPGDCSITLLGGHNYEILQDDTIIYEFKTGPYMGPGRDKESI